MRLFLHGRSSTSNLLNSLARSSKHSNITCLLLSGWVVSDDMMIPENFELVQTLLEFLNTHEELNEVILQNCSGKHLKSLIFGILQSSPQTLTIRYDRQQELPTEIATGLVQGTPSKSTTRLNLQGITLTSELVQDLQTAILENFPSLQELNIKGNILLHDIKQGDSIFGYYETESIPQSAAKVTMKNLLTQIPNLEKLRLESCHIEDATLAFLIQGALENNNLKHLHLQGNHCQDETMRVLHNHLMKQNCQLQNLNLSWQQLPSRKISMKKIPTTRKANLEELPLLAKALKKNTSLKRLNLSENRLSEMSVQILARTLEKNMTLERLDMKDCHLSGTSFAFLAESLPHMHLKSLHVDGLQKVNYNQKKLRRLFLKPLMKNVYLEDLAMNDISPSMELILEWNRAGRRAVMEGESMAPSLWPLVLERADRICRREQSNPEQATHHGATAIFNLLQASNAKTQIRS